MSAVFIIGFGWVLTSAFFGLALARVLGHLNRLDAATAKAARNIGNLVAALDADTDNFDRRVGRLERLASSGRHGEGRSRLTESAN